MSDAARLYVVAAMRAVATSVVGVVLGLELLRRGFEGGAIGLVVSVGLGGAALAAGLTTLLGDRLGRRLLLVLVALLGAAGIAAVTLLGSLPLLLVAAGFGMVNGMGRDRGSALILEQAALAQVAPDRERTRAFALYSVAQDGGHAVGALVVWLGARGAGVTRPLLLGAAALVGLSALLVLGLSAAVEAPPAPRGPRLTPASRRVLWRLSALFALDSVGGGFLTAALLAYFFHGRFGVSAATVGALFFAARVANAGSHLGAASLARRIGLVRTMVFTHLPSSLLLVTVAIAPSFWVAAALFLLRESLVEMDVPTRQSYVMAVVRPEERTVAAGVTHIVRMAGWAIAPAFAGRLMADADLWWPLGCGAALKITYDLVLYRLFSRLRPPEERGSAAS